MDKATAIFQMYALPLVHMCARGNGNISTDTPITLPLVRLCAWGNYTIGKCSSPLWGPESMIEGITAEMHENAYLVAQ